MLSTALERLLLIFDPLLRALDPSHEDCALRTRSTVEFGLQIKHSLI
jgi:hypothetical protein